MKFDSFSSDGSTEGKTTLIVSDEVFSRLFGIHDYTLLMVQLDKKATDKTVNEIGNVLDEG